MRLKKIISYATVAIVALSMVIPTDAFAARSSLDYEYVDENGEVIEDTYKGIKADTSWFDYQNPQKEYNISTEEELVGFASLINKKQRDRWKPNAFETFEGITINLTADVTLTHDWVPTGSNYSKSFKGTFDGQGHVIRGVNLKDAGNNIGFFGYLDGTVKNLDLEGTINCDGDNCGTIAGHLTDKGRIISCKSHVNITGKNRTGGIVGDNNGKVKNSINFGNVKGAAKVGGIVGENQGKIVQCGNRGIVTSNQRGVATYGTGGIAGRSLSGALVNNCYNTGEVNSKTECTGGIVGYINVANSKIVNCYSTGNIIVDNKSSSTVSLTNSQKVKGYAGGIAGVVGSKDVFIRNCYSTSQITNSDVSGGIIGYYIANINSDNRNIENNYFLSTVAKNGIGEDKMGRHQNVIGAKSLSSSALMNNASTLGINYREDVNGLYGNNSYPVLTWQEENSEEDRVYLPHISIKLQKKLDKYSEKVGKENTKNIGMIFNFSETNIENVGEFNEKKHVQPIT